MIRPHQEPNPLTGNCKWCPYWEPYNSRNHPGLDHLGIARSHLERMQREQAATTSPEIASRIGKDLPQLREHVTYLLSR